MKNENSYDVLVVDDEKDLCDLLQTVCKNRGLSTHIAYNKKEASNELRGHPGLIFLDYNLPDGTGLELIPVIREQAGNSFVVMITAQNSDKLQEEVINSGINYLLLKPFDLSSVNLLIEKAIQCLFVPKCLERKAGTASN